MRYIGANAAGQADIKTEDNARNSGTSLSLTLQRVQTAPEFRMAHSSCQDLLSQPNEMTEQKPTLISCSKSMRDSNLLNRWSRHHYRWNYERSVPAKYSTHCELIAIGCIVAQGDYASFKSFREADNPKSIFFCLGKIYAGFFPLPARVTRDENNIITHIERYHSMEAMSQSDSESIWSKTGNFLHRLTTTSYFRIEDRDNKIFWPDYIEMVGKFRALLNPHITAVKSAKALILASLNYDSGKPSLTFIDYEGGNAQSISLHNFHGSGETLYWREPRLS
jgi:hypothetical protein